MLNYWSEYNDVGMTVPYPSYRGQGRNNRGFVDLRGRPDLALKVAETEASPAFKALIVQLAQPNSQTFSVGCDLGTKVTDAGAARYMAGGYVQIVHRDYAPLSPEDYMRYAEAHGEALEALSEGHEWKVDFMSQCIDFLLDDYSNLIGSLSIKFDAYGQTAEEAVASREVLISKIGELLADDKLIRVMTHYDLDEQDD